MIITIVADVLGQENNGTTTACMNLVRYLRSQGDEVRIVCCDQDKVGVPGYFVTRPYNLGSFLNHVLEKNNVTLAYADKKVIARAIEGTDIVHVMIPFALGNAAAKMAKKKKIPVTAGFHCQAENFTSHIGMMNLSIANYITYKTFYRHLYRFVNGIHYPTEFIHQTFEKNAGHRTNAYVISNGVNDCFVRKSVERPAEYQGKFLILFTGRYSREKSHSVLIRAVAKSKYKESIQLIFAGQGPKHDRLVALSRKLKITMPVMKFFSREELVNVINYSDLYCHPAEIEIEAIACLEAISCGLVPVIADSPRCATRYFALDERNLFRYNSVTDLARKIDYWIEHPAEKEKRSREYLGYTRQFNQEECMIRMRNMLCSFVNKGK